MKIIVYNPIGAPRVVELPWHTFIQGKPILQDSYNADGIFVFDKDKVDKEWFNKNIYPFGAINDVKIKYV